MLNHIPKNTIHMTHSTKSWYVDIFELLNHNTIDIHYATSFRLNSLTYPSMSLSLVKITNPTKTYQCIILERKLDSRSFKVLTAIFYPFLIFISVFLVARQQLSKMSLQTWSVMTYADMLSSHNQFLCKAADSHRYILGLTMSPYSILPSHYHYRISHHIS